MIGSVKPLISTFYLRLYTNNVVPAVGFKASNYTQPTGSWYAPVLLNQWGGLFVNQFQQGEVDEVIHTYIAAGTIVNESVYGYYVTDPNGLLAWAERGPAAPYAMNAAGLKVIFQPKFMCGLLC